jgi:uncharacterized membrane protein
MAEKRMSLNEKLDEILANQKKILRNEEKILGEEKKLEDMESEELKNEESSLNSEEEALRELEKLEKAIKQGSLHPLKKVTRRDIFKSFIGAFFGIMGHFAFYKGADIAAGLSILRATVLYLVAFVIIIVMLYYTGFRKIKTNFVMKFLPYRAVIIYLVSALTIIIVNLLFNKVHFPIHFSEVYTLVGASIILAVIGAGTADLIGGGAE